MANRPPEGRVSVHVSYTDETEVKNGRFMIAGYVADELEWPKFSEQWERDIIKSDPPSPYLHMVESRSREWREKYGITKEQGEEKVRRAVNLISGTDAMTGFISQISMIKHAQMSKKVEYQGAEF
jgi:hypothetical protein